MQLNDLPYQPIRSGLYSAAELFAGFDPDEPRSFAATTDFAIYRHFIRTGGVSPRDALGSMMQSLHDNAISQALNRFLRRKRCVAIMGGHRMRRDDPEYRQIAHLARLLGRDSFLIASGGGPGAMEAAHLGARLCRGTELELDQALDVIAREPELPPLGEIVDKNGKVDRALAAQAHRWVKVAAALGRETSRNANESLAVPTWRYGFEPSSPLATHIAKYFQNSIREDGLLALATHGIIYTPGEAGTLQEVFQDAAQNYYHSFADAFSPMVFKGVEFWTQKVPVRDTLHKLFALDRTKAAEFKARTLFTDDIRKAHRFIMNFKPASPAAKSKGVPAMVANPPKTG